MLAFPQKTIENDFSNAATPDYSDFEMIDEIWDGEQFDAINFNKLVDYVFPQNVFPNGTDNFYYAAMIMGIYMFPWNLYNWNVVQNGYFVQRKNAVVKFAGYNWLPVLAVGQCYEKAYENGGNNNQIHQIILTLLYFDDVSDLSTQLLPGLTKDDYDYYPAYGSSYINAVVLNNGGQYLNKDGTYTTATKDPKHKFAAYTTDENLTQYLITPNQHMFQATKNVTFSAGGFQYYLNQHNNEAVYNSSYSDSQYYDAWGDSTLWLPSADETTSINNPRLQGGAFGLKDISLETSWTRNCDNSAYSDGRINYTVEPWNTAIARPALHLNLTKAAQNLKWPNLADDVAEYDQSDPNNEAFKDIYKITTETGVDFHIKTAEGFLKLSEATSAGQSFDQSWAFYLDEDIDITSVCDHFTPVGGESNPFLGKFDGQGHKITYSQKNFGAAEDPSSVNIYASLFGTAGSSIFQNLSIYADIIITMEETYNGNASVFIYSMNDATCYISHVNLDGNLSVYNTDFVFDSAIINQVHNSDVYVYDVYSNIGFALIMKINNIGSTKRVEINDCRITSAYGVVAINAAGNLILNNVDINSDIVGICGLTDNVNITLTGCQLIGKSAGALIGTYSGNNNISLYDCVITISQLPQSSGDDDTLNITAVGAYAIVIIESDFQIVILDPNFTSYKWCMDPHLNDGLPQLKRFVSIGEHMEQCDMQTWAKDKPTYEF